MARIARIIVPDCPHHVVQRGNRQQRTFFLAADFQTYLRLLAECCQLHQVEIWSYCLMPNHVHLIAVPQTSDGLSLAIGKTHQRYTQILNTREEWTGRLWQGRFSSVVMDAAHLYEAARYVELNPVRAGLVARPEDYTWSSASAHLRGEDDLLVYVAPLLQRYGDWRAYLAEPLPPTALERLRKHEKTGRPLGSDDFLRQLEATLGQSLIPKKRGPKPRWKRRG